MVLKKSEYLAPFWGAKYQYTKGLGQLGIQATSQATYAVLLPGITNLTARIRYYGFYCWLLELYAEKENPKSVNGQRAFIRKAELIIALIMQKHKKEAGQIPGSTYAANELARNGIGDYDLNRGVDLSQRDNYWKNPSGVLGQYYQGAMDSIGLIGVLEENGLIVCTENHEGSAFISGTVMARAFEKNITDRAVDSFYDAIKTGILKASEMKTLFESFDITSIPEGTDESSCYEKILVDSDHPATENPDVNKTYFRRDTIKNILRHTNTKGKDDYWENFKTIFYLGKGDKQKSDVSIGWYYYELNEYWNYACESVMLAFLMLIERDRETEVNQVIRKLVDFILEGLHDNNRIKDENTTVRTAIDNVVYEGEYPYIGEEQLLEHINDALKLQNVKFLSALGVELLMLLSNNNKQLNALKELSTKYNMTRGLDCIEGLTFWEIHQNISIKQFLEKWLLRFIVNRHLEVAYRKMGNGSKQTHKFTIEDNKFRFKDLIELNWTSPRLGVLHSILMDLGYMDNSETGGLTQKGSKLLNQIEG